MTWKHYIATGLVLAALSLTLNGLSGFLFTALVFIVLGSWAWASGEVGLCGYQEYGFSWEPSVLWDHIRTEDGPQSSLLAASFLFFSPASTELRRTSSEVA